MNALVIYDGTGKIWNIVYGADESDRPVGILNMFVDIPDGAVLQSIDVSDPANHTPVYTYMPESDIGRLMREVKELSYVDAKNKEELSMAIVDLYEMVLEVQSLAIAGGEENVDGTGESTDTGVPQEDSPVTEPDTLSDKVATQEEV